MAFSPAVVSQPVVWFCQATGFFISAKRKSVVKTRFLTAALLLISAVWASQVLRRGESQSSRNSADDGAASDLDQHRASMTAADFTADWPCLYGPHGSSESGESSLSWQWSGDGPPVRWQVTIGTGYSAPVVSQENLVLLHRQQDAELVTCVSAEAGVPRWEHRSAATFECEYPNYSSGPYSTPVISDGMVYAQGAAGMLHCLSMIDGTIHWSRDLTREYAVPLQGYGVAHSPLFDNGRLYLNLGGTIGDSAVVALDAQTGETLWTAGVSPDAREWGLSCATPVLAQIEGKSWLLVLAADALLCLDPDDGRVTDRFAASAHNRSNPSATTPLVVGDRVLLSVCLSDCWCLRIGRDGRFEEMWKSGRTLESLFNPLSFSEGCVFGWHSFDRTLRCIDLLTGDVRWKARTEFSRGSHVLADGRLYIIGEHGEFGVVEANTLSYRRLFATSEPLLSSPCFSPPALSGRRLFIRNEQRLVCLDVSMK